MRRVTLQLLAIAVFVITLNIVLPRAAFAEEEAAAAEHTVVVNSSQELLTAFGVVILDGESPPQTTAAEGISAQKPRIRRRKANIAKQQAPLWDITVQLEPGDAVPGAKIVAVAMDKDGRAVSSLVQWLVAPETPATPASVSCRQQRNISRLNELRMLNEKDLQDLVALRRRRKGVLSGLLKDISVPALFKSLNASERKLGIARPTPLSADTSFEELLERMGTIDALLKAEK